MCRLFGQHARPGFDPCEPLCSAENALRFQSHRHRHGWGIGWYEDSTPMLRVGTMPAHADDAFVEAARAVRGRIVVAHVRDASVGPVAPENTHPFRWRRWLFAHNGTLARYMRSPRVREALLAEIDRDLRAEIRGETDSERCFYLFVTRLRARADIEAAGLQEVRRALADTTDALLSIAHPDDGAKPSSLNFLVSDGRLLAACRLGRSLHLAVDAGPRHAFVVASERIGAAAWEEIPDGGFAGIDEGGHAVVGAVREGARPASRGRDHSSPATGKPRG